MRNTEQTLQTAISELSCISPDRPASLEELASLNSARDCLEQLLRSCIAELRTHPETTYSWSKIAYALGSSPTSTREKYGRLTQPGGDPVTAFWETFADEFVWDFLPVRFTYALYLRWSSEMYPERPPLARLSFSRQLTVAAATVSDEWVYTRSRVGSLLDAPEPLVERIPNWAVEGLESAQYGLRRTGRVRLPDRIIDRE